MRSARGNHALSAGDEPQAAGEIRLPEELSSICSGCVCALHGSEASIRSAVDRYDDGGDWTTSVTSSDLVLSPAACYPVYPIAATRGAAAERRVAVRHRSGRLPSRALAQPGSAAIVSHARVRENWLARGNSRVSRKLDGQGAGPRCRPQPAVHHRRGKRSVLRPGWTSHGGRASGSRP